MLSSTVTPTLKTYTDGISGEQVFTYHAALTGLSPNTTYSYQISDGASPAGTFPASGVSSFTTAPTGRSAFMFTSFGDLGTPGLPFSSAQWGESQYNAFYAVNEVEALAPLFHLMNGDLCYADKNQTSQPEVWRDFGLNVQRSASNRPWMPCVGNHEIELGTTKYSLPGSANNENGGCIERGLHRPPGQQRPDHLVGEHARGRRSRHDNRLDCRADAPNGPLLIARQWKRPRDSRGLAPPIRSIPG
jgi:hypothetical protein